MIFTISEEQEETKVSLRPGVKLENRQKQWAKAAVDVAAAAVKAAVIAGAAAVAASIAMESPQQRDNQKLFIPKSYPKAQKQPLKCKMSGSSGK